MDDNNHLRYYLVQYCVDIYIITHKRDQMSIGLVVLVDRDGTINVLQVKYGYDGPFSNVIGNELRLVARSVGIAEDVTPTYFMSTSDTSWYYVLVTIPHNRGVDMFRLTDPSIKGLKFKSVEGRVNMKDTSICLAVMANLHRKE